MSKRKTHVLEQNTYITRNNKHALCTHVFPMFYMLDYSNDHYQ